MKHLTQPEIDFSDFWKICDQVTENNLKKFELAASWKINNSYCSAIDIPLPTMSAGYFNEILPYEL